MSLDAVRLDELRRSLTDVERELGSLVAFVEAPSAAPASDVGGSLNQIAADLGETLQAVRTAMGALPLPVEPPSPGGSRRELLFDVAPDGLVETTRSGVVRDVNRCALAMFGVERTQLVGTSLADVVAVGDRRRFRRFLSSCRADGRSGVDGRSGDDGRSGVDGCSGIDLRIRCEGGVPFDAALHVARVGQGGDAMLLWSVRNVSDRRQLVEQLTFHATHDHLTMVANRRHFLQILTRRLRSRVGPDRSTVVLFIDLDRFKAVNDRLGHPAGDELLAAAGERVRSLLRDGDLLGRIGGDEFAVALDDEPGGPNGAALADRILVALGAPFALAEGIVHVGASIGMVVVEPGRLRAEDVLRDADIAMYASKEAGGNRCTVFSVPLRARAVARVDAEAELRMALGNRQLAVHYQPVVDLEDGHVVAVEALLRWHHPVRGVLAASEFIDDLENSGLIVAAGSWALRRAMADVRGWIDAGAPAGLGLLANVSPRQFADPEFAEALVDEALRAGLEPGQLCIEVTERTAVESGRRGVDALRRLRLAGVQVALDDFGTGYSSLAYLHDLPVDVVKIDQSFVGRLLVSREDRLIVVAIVQLARTLGLTTVAEGVEAVEHIGALRAAGCDRVQGFYVWPPAPAEELAALLSSGWHLPMRRRARVSG